MSIDAWSIVISVAAIVINAAAIALAVINHRRGTDA